MKKFSIMMGLTGCFENDWIDAFTPFFIGLREGMDVKENRMKSSFREVPYYVIIWLLFTLDGPTPFKVFLC